MTSMWWSVNIETAGAGGIDSGVFERFAEVLAPHGGIVTVPAEVGVPRYGARLSVEADSAKAASDRAVDIFNAAVVEAAMPVWMIVHVDVMTEQELEQELARPVMPELVGVTEIAALLAKDGQPVSRQRASAVTKRDDFPEPVAVLAAGPVWTKNSVRNFVDGWQRKPGRPAKVPPTLDLSMLTAGQVTDGLLVAGLALLIGYGVYKLVQWNNGQQVIEATSTVLPAGAPVEAAKVYDFTKTQHRFVLPTNLAQQLEKAV